MRLNSENRILNVLFENNQTNFTVRNISNLSKVPRSTVQRILENMRKERIIDKENKLIVSTYTRIKKINFFIEKIVLSGLVDFLIEKLNPSCIIVFGSFSKGDYVKESDIDLFVETSVKNNIDLSTFERKLRHKIDLFVESDVKNLQINLRNNVINGIKLYGEFKLK